MPPSRAIWIAALLAAACGPGAGDRPPLGTSEATLATALGDDFWAAPSTLRAPLTGDWSCNGVCIHGGVHASAPPPPEVQDMVGTFGPKGDGDLGVIEWRGKIPKGVSAIAIPILAAPGPDRAQVQVRVSGGGVHRLETPTQGWRFWRLHVKSAAGARSIRITVRDEGVGVGEWVAVGAPFIVE